MLWILLKGCIFGLSWNTTRTVNSSLSLWFYQNYINAFMLLLHRHIKSVPSWSLTINVALAQCGPAGLQWCTEDLRMETGAGVTQHWRERTEVPSTALGLGADDTLGVVTLRPARTHHPMSGPPILTWGAQNLQHQSHGKYYWQLDKNVTVSLCFIFQLKSERESATVDTFGFQGNINIKDTNNPHPFFVSALSAGVPSAPIEIKCWFPSFIPD